MKEAERVRLYNDLTDYEMDLKSIIYPPKTKEIDMIQRAIACVRGERGKWIASNGTNICNRCRFDEGKSSFRYCPNCGAKME